MATDEDDNCRKESFKDLLTAAELFLLPCACFFPPHSTFFSYRFHLPPANSSRIFTSRNNKNKLFHFDCLSSLIELFDFSRFYLWIGCVCALIESQMENSIKTCTTHHGTQLFDKRLRCMWTWGENFIPTVGVG